MTTKKPKARPAARRTSKAKAAPKRRAAKAAPAAKRPPSWSAAQKSQFAALQARAKALGATLKRADFDSDGNPLPGGPWASLLADLHAWARTYNVKIETREHDHAEEAPAGGDGPGGAAPRASHAACPGSFSETSKRKFVGMTQIRTTSCTLRRQTWLGRCVYDCVENIEWV